MQQWWHGGYANPATFGGQVGFLAATYELSKSLSPRRRTSWQSATAPLEHLKEFSVKKQEKDGSLKLLDERFLSTALNLCKKK